MTADISEPVTDETEDLREFLEECAAAILECVAGLPRPEAVLEAAVICAAYARYRGYLWASLRAALADYPVLLAQLPRQARPRGRPALPSVVTVAVLKGKRVLRQGKFAGSQDVKV